MIDVNRCFCSPYFLFTKNMFFTFVCRSVAYGGIVFLFPVWPETYFYILYEGFDKTDFFVKRRSLCCCEAMGVGGFLSLLFLVSKNFMLNFEPGLNGIVKFCDVAELI